MLNWYEGYLDTNLVMPLGVDRVQVIFDFYFADVSPAAAERNRRSMDVSERIQDEDHAICESVQRGLGSRAYQQAASRCAARPANTCSTSCSPATCAPGWALDKRAARGWQRERPTPQRLARPRPRPSPSINEALSVDLLVFLRCPSYAIDHRS